MLREKGAPGMVVVRDAADRLLCFVLSVTPAG